MLLQSWVIITKDGATVESLSFLPWSVVNSSQSFPNNSYFRKKETLAAWKMFIFRVFLVHIQSEFWKIWTRKAANTDTFHAVAPTYLATCTEKDPWKKRLLFGQCSIMLDSVETNVDATLIQRCFNLASTSVQAILNRIRLVMIMNLQIDE